MPRGRTRGATHVVGDLEFAYGAARIEGVAHEIAAAGFDGVELQRFVEVIRGRARKILDLGRKGAGA